MTFEIYIHVPFCLRRCGYCDFNTYTAVDMGAGASRGNYANMVIREMAIVRDWQTTHGINEPKVATVFFGGGTPTTLKASDLVAMLDAVRATWGIAVFYGAWQVFGDVLYRCQRVHVAHEVGATGDVTLGAVEERIKPLVCR